MARIIPFLLVIFVFGCAHIPESSSLYSEFSAYKKSVDNSTLTQKYADYFDPSLTADIDFKDSSTVDQLEFSKYMIREAGHFEVVQGNRGCLTVNGTGSDNNPIALYIEYKRADGKWLISDVDVSFLENAKDYEAKALCPSEVRVE